VDALRALIRLTGVELVKIWRKPLAWVVLGIMLLGSAGGECILATISHQDAIFPNTARMLFASPILLFVALATVVVATLALGNDYDLGTVRPILARGVPRYQFLLAKIVATVSVALANGLAYMAGGLLTIAVFQRLYSDTPFFEAAGRDVLVRAAGAVGIIGLVGFVSAGTVMVALVLGRASWVGLLAGIGLFLGDFYVGGFRMAGGDAYRHTVTYNALSLLERAFPSDVTDSWISLGGLAAPGQAAATLLLYGCTLTLVAILLFRRQDLTAKG
jgi:ABC-type transport system involved in multi-copper enzyme maturation permease subunit